MRLPRVRWGCSIEGFNAEMEAEHEACPALEVFNARPTIQPCLEAGGSIRVRVHSQGGQLLRPRPWYLDYVPSGRFS